MRRGGDCKQNFVKIFFFGFSPPNLQAIPPIPLRLAHVGREWMIQRDW
jgi:hypothetical protein